MELCHSCRAFHIHTLHEGLLMIQDVQERVGCRYISIQCLLRGYFSACPCCSLFYTDLEEQIENLEDPTHYCVEIRLCKTARANHFIRGDNQADTGYTVLRVNLAQRLWSQAGGIIEGSLHPPDKVHEYRVVAEKGGAAWNSGLIGHHHLGHNASSHHHAERISELLDQCRLSHTTCCKTLFAGHELDPMHAPLPSRCVRIEESGFRLCDTSNSSGSYITLSHRWNGATEACKTTYANLNSRLQNIPATTLPQSFLDAIKVAKQLGVEYVWIDSICIVQHPKDWAVESLKMAQYYQHSLCNIAIVDGSADGFLKNRPGKTLPRLVQLPYRDCEGQWKGYLYIYKGPDPDDEFRDGIEQSALLQRGWVFQEWLLSPRIIYFCPEQIFFECQSSRPVSEKGGLVSSYNFNSSAFKSGFLGKENMVDAEEAWYSIVETYSHLDLTQPAKDHVLALAGVATEIRDALSEQDNKNGRHVPLDYIAGLWVRDIYFGLLWEKDPLDKRAITYVTKPPSWSWASVMTAVKWPERESASIPVMEIRQLIKYDPEEAAPARVFDLPDLILHETYSLGVDTVSCSLVVRTFVIQIVVQSQLLDHEVDVMINATENTIERSLTKKVRSPKWHGISVEAAPNILVGWASFERELPVDEETPIYAAAVSMTLVSGGLGYGYLDSNHPVFAILCCVQVAPEKFRRIGVGRIFAKEAVTLIDNVSADVVELV